MVTKYPKWAWLWWNDEDGAGKDPRFWKQWIWLAWRNPVDNIKYSKGVANVGGFLWYKTWFWWIPTWNEGIEFKQKQYYYKIGYLPNNGYPCLQPFGAGRGY